MSHIQYHSTLLVGFHVWLISVTVFTLYEMIDLISDWLVKYEIKIPATAQ